MKGEICAFTDIKQKIGYDSKPLTDALRKMDYIKAVYETSGTYDIRVLLIANSVHELNSYINKIRELKQVEDTETNLILKIIK